MTADKKVLHELIDKLPEGRVAEVMDFISRLNIKIEKKIEGLTNTNDYSLAKAWEEDGAWRD
ncbi:MAG: hypothetical protein K0S71_1768 [Clostridia bacterium]|jgi:hypothetical protein|nr:hypothetical protein [Clostridia bacterium]